MSDPLIYDPDKVEVYFNNKKLKHPSIVEIEQPDKIKLDISFDSPVGELKGYVFITTEQFEAMYALDK